MAGHRSFRLLVCFLLLMATRSVAAGAGAQDSPRLSIDGPPPPVAPAIVARDDQGRVTMRATRVDPNHPLKIDGVLDEAIYTQVPSVSDFIQQEPHEGAAATEKTEVWVFFDHRNVYVSARCWDSHPERMVVNEMRRDQQNIFQNENVTVVFDTFYDRRSGVFFQTNPLGAIRDQEVTSERDNNNDWNTVWDSHSRMFAQGWTLEMVIPFKSLRYRESGPQIWGINVRRVVRWKNEQSFLTRIPASYGFRGIYKFSSAATLVGVETPEASQNLELKPYVIAAVTSNEVAPVPFSNDLSVDAGIDLKYGLTRSLISDFTYNTDFAQVEQDDQQVNLTRFSLFFPEKRDFFLEGQGIFAFGGAQLQQGGGGVPGGGGNTAGNTRTSNPDLTPILFFSRNIGLAGGQAIPIIAGGRVTGRAGKFAIGALDIQTGDSNIVDRPAANFAALRLRRDILRRSTIGVIATRRDPATSGAGTNETMGLDTNLAFYQNINVIGYWARTWTPGLTGGTDQNASYRAQFDYAPDRYGVQVEHLSVGQDFNPEVGFLRREAFRRSYAFLRFSPRPKSMPAIRKFSYEASLDYITDPGGSLETREQQGSFRIELNNSDQFTLDYARTYDLLDTGFEISPGVIIPPGGYNYQDLRGSYSLGQQRRVWGTITLAHGSFYSGDKTEVGYGGRAKITTKVSVEPRFSFNWVDLSEGSFVTKLVGGRLIVTLTPRVFFSGLIQYNSSTSSLTSNLRFRWEYQPGSDLFVVYSDGRDTTVRGFPGLLNRTVVVKATKLFRF